MLIRFILGISIFGAVAAFAAPVNVTTKTDSLRWLLDKGLATPESVYFDVASGQTFVANVAGAPNAKDGNGWVGVITLNKAGKPSVKKLVGGLDAPKGLRAKDGILWVSDIDTMVAIDLKKKKVAKKIAVPGAVFLNDTAFMPNGDLLVSDTVGGKIYQIAGDTVSVFEEGDKLESPNGLLVDQGKLYVAAWGKITDPATWAAPTPGNLYSIDLASKAITKITKAPLGNLDGLEIAPDGTFYTSDFVTGKVYKVGKDGTAVLFAEGAQNAADIGLSDTVVLIPDMGKSRIFAVSVTEPKM